MIYNKYTDFLKMEAEIGFTWLDADGERKPIVVHLEGKNAIAGVVKVSSATGLLIEPISSIHDREEGYRRGPECYNYVAEQYITGFSYYRGPQS